MVRAEGTSGWLVAGAAGATLRVEGGRLAASALVFVVLLPLLVVEITSRIHSVTASAVEKGLWKNQNVSTSKRNVFSSLYNFVYKIL